MCWVYLTHVQIWASPAAHVILGVDGHVNGAAVTPPHKPCQARANFMRFRILMHMVFSRYYEYAINTTSIRDSTSNGQIFTEIAKWVVLEYCDNTY